MVKVAVVDLEQRDVEDIELSDRVFAGPVRPDVIARVVNWQLARRRRGSHKVKQRAEVRGSTRKPYRQKGMGRARQGSVRSPQFRGGGVVFGPVLRDHAFGLPKKVRRFGLRSVLAEKLRSGELAVLEEAKLAEPKTRVLVAHLDRLGWKSALIVDGQSVDAGFSRAAANIPGIDTILVAGLNVYDILRRDQLILTRNAVAALEDRLI